MKTDACGIGHMFVFVICTVVLATKTIFWDFIIAQIGININVIGLNYIATIFFGIAKLILVIFFFFSRSQCRVFFNFSKYLLLKRLNGQLYQLHKLNLLWR